MKKEMEKIYELTEKEIKEKFLLSGQEIFKLKKANYLIVDKEKLEELLMLNN